MSVNVVISGLPWEGSLCLQVGDKGSGIAAGQVHDAIRTATGLPEGSLLLLSHSRVLRLDDFVTLPGDETAFVCAVVRRALPGGKGGFGAQLRGSSSSTRTTNFDACRDLRGRRIGAVRREREAATAAAAAAAATVAVEAATVTPTDKTGYVDRGAGSDSGETNSTSILQHSCKSQKRRRDDNEQTAFSVDDTSHVAAAAAATAAIAEKGHSTATSVADAVADALRSGIPVSTSKRQCPVQHAMSTLLHGYESSSSTSSSDASDCDELEDNTKRPNVLSSNDG